MIDADSKEIGELLSEIPKCQVKEFKGEIEHSETTTATSLSTEPNDSPFRVRRLSRSFSIPYSSTSPSSCDKEEILLSDENHRDSLNYGDKSKSKFILLKRSRSLGNIFLPDQQMKQPQEKEPSTSASVDDLTENFEALEIEVLKSNDIEDVKKCGDNLDKIYSNNTVVDSDSFNNTVDSNSFNAADSSICYNRRKFTLIDRPQTSPPVLYPSKRDSNKPSEKLSILDRMQKSLGFIFRCARKDESSSEEESMRRMKYPQRSRTPDAKLYKAKETKEKKETKEIRDTKDTHISTSATPASPVNTHNSDVHMQAINFITKVDETSKSSGEIVKKLAQFVDVSGPKGPLLAPQHSLHEGKKCLVLDLDETLVHSSFHVPLAHDLVVSLGLPDGTQQNIYVAKRPGVDEFLARVSQVFEVVIFTASLSHYADPVIDFLTVEMNQHTSEPKEISLRLYRESCLFLRGLYVKDLSRLGRKLEHTVIVDNSPASFLLQPEHGIPIKSWFNDVNDRELPLLQESLEHFIEAESVVEWRSLIQELGNNVSCV